MFKKGDVVRLSELKNFYKDALQIKKKVEKQIDEAGFFEKSFLSKRNFYRMAGLLGFFFLFSFGIVANRVDFILGSILSLIIVMIFAAFMSKKTKKGMETFLHLKGFEEYIRTAERYRIRFQEQENLFEKYLSFAMLLVWLRNGLKPLKALSKRLLIGMNHLVPLFLFMVLQIVLKTFLAKQPLKAILLLRDRVFLAAVAAAAEEAAEAEAGKEQLIQRGVWF